MTKRFDTFLLFRFSSINSEYVAEHKLKNCGTKTKIAKTFLFRFHGKIVIPVERRQLSSHRNSSMIFFAQSETEMSLSCKSDRSQKLLAWISYEELELVNKNELFLSSCRKLISLSFLLCERVLK